MNSKEKVIICSCVVLLQFDLYEAADHRKGFVLHVYFPAYLPPTLVFRVLNCSYKNFQL
jgi:hypothetical protein